jgi:hypothetical protein
VNLIGHGSRGVPGIDPHDGHADLGERAVDDLLEDRALVLEVQVKRAPRDQGGRDDVLDLGLVVTAARKHVAGMVQDLLPPFGLAHR